MTMYDVKEMEMYSKIKHFAQQIELRPVNSYCGNTGENPTSLQNKWAVSMSKTVLTIVGWVVGI